MESLGDIGDARAVSALIDALKGERLSVRQKIANVLGRLTHQNFGEEYHAWAKWRDQENKPIVEQR
jgi:HEAT repeat protein